MDLKESLLPPIASVDPVSQQHWLLLGAVNLALGAVAFAVSHWGGDTDWAVHGVWCVAVMLCNAPAVMLGVRAGVGTLLVDHRFIFLAAYLAYFSFGASLPAFGSELAAEGVFSFYPITPQDALWVDGFNGCGIGVALVAATLLNFPRTAVIAHLVALRFSKISVTPVLISMLFVGLIASNYILAIDLGVVDGTPSGLARAAPRLAWVAILLAAAVRSRDSVVLKVLAGSTALGLAIIGLLQFNKSECLYPICTFVLGLAWSRQSTRYLLSGVCFVILLFSLLGDLTATGRNLLDRSDGRSLGSRMALLGDSYKLVSAGAIDQRYVGWARFCYLSPQVAAIDLRNADRGGDTFDLLPWVFVPRFLYPEKPEMTKGGRDFNEKVTGNSLSATGQGAFVAGYYSGGFWGWAFSAAVAGICIRFLSIISAKILEAGAIVLTPVPLLGVLVAFGIDGEVVTYHIATVVLVAYPLFGAWLLIIFGHVSELDRQFSTVPRQL